MEIRLKNLTKIFTTKKGDKTVAVDNLTVTIPSGKLVGLLGPSGCGKSTTLYMIAGLLKPTGGEIYFGNNNVTKLSADKRGIGLVFQNYALYPHMTVKQNIMFPLENLKISYKEAEKLVVEMAELVGIKDQLDKKPAQLSGGQQQRVAIARALVKKPQVLLLDEPLSNLDARLRLQTREEIKRIQRETGITTIFVTHDQEEAMSISDEMLLMNFGVQQQLNSPQDTYNRPINEFVARFLGTPPINMLEGEVIDGKVMIADFLVGTTNIKDGKYKVGIRPEHFTISGTKGNKTEIFDVEHIGRDTLLRFKIGENIIRALVNSDEIKSRKKNYNINVKENKFHLFDIKTGSVINEK